MTLLRLAFGNWFSRGYLLLVGAAAVPVTWSVVTWDQPDANLAPALMFLLTLPGSLIAGALPDHPAAGIAAVVLGALLNATLIGGLVALVRRPRRPGRAARV
jgi:hypothetical protein